MLKTGLALVLTAAIVLGLNKIYVLGDGTDPDGVAKFQTMPASIEICNFGSSHGVCGFNYENWEDKYSCFNFALGAQSLLYDSRLLNYYQDHIAEGAIVIIPISYFSFYGEPEDQENDFESKNKRYYKILPPEDITDYNYQLDVLMKYPVTTAYEKLFPEICPWSPVTAAGDQPVATAADINIEAAAEDAYTRHLVKGKTNDDGSMIVNDENVSAVYKMIEICRERGARPVLVTPPFLWEYTKQAEEHSPGFFEGYYAQINEIVTETGAEYFDYSRDERFIHEPELFMDIDHLNHNGSLLFTDVLLDGLIKKASS